MTAMGTEVFLVTIEKVAENTFQVYAEGRKDEQVAVTFIPDADFNERLDRLYDRGDLRFLSFLAQENACTFIGECLFTNFFVGPVLKRYREYQTRLDNDSVPRIAIQMSRSLYYLPWEVIRDPDTNLGQFLSMQGSVTRYDLRSSQPDSTLFADSPNSSTYLFLLANVEERPLGPFEPVDHDPITFLKVDPATYNNFGTRLRKHQPFGLVFFGHGDVYEDAGYLIFPREEWRRFRKYYPSDPKAGFAVGGDLGGIKPMRIAYILACESAWAKRTTGFENSIAGSILLRTGLAFVIGAQTPIDFFAAREFFERTLEALIDGYPLDLAVSEGRRQILAMNPRDAVGPRSHLDWWVPVMYARTINFDILPKRESIPTTLESPTRDVTQAESADYLGALRRSASRLFSSDSENAGNLL